MRHPMQPFLYWSPFGLLPFLFLNRASPLLRNDFETSRSIAPPMSERARSKTAEIIDFETYRQRRLRKHSIARSSFGAAGPRRDR